VVQTIRKNKETHSQFGRVTSVNFRPYRCGLIHKSNVSDHVKSRDSFLNFHLDGRKLFLYYSEVMLTRRITWY